MRLFAPVLSRARDPKALLRLEHLGMSRHATAPLARIVALAGQAQASDTWK